MKKTDEGFDNIIRCSFCGRDEGSVEFLIPSPILDGAYICNDCIEACCRIIDDHKERNAKSDTLSNALFTDSTSTR